MRILLYSVVPSAPWVLAIQLLHGCTFGLYLIASVTLVHELVGSELAATAQGLLASAMAFGHVNIPLRLKPRGLYPLLRCRDSGAIQ